MQITESKPGMPCWFELASSNSQESFNFYHQLFGWKRTDMDLGPMGIYSFLSKENGTIGALCEMQPEQKQQGAPSVWAVYFAVENCDASTGRAVQLGATLLVPPMDVSEHGRMSVLNDPSGATFYLWQSKPASNSGEFVMFEDHAIGWVELASKDTAESRRFYGALFGWDFLESPIPIADAGQYIEFAVGQTRYGGLLPMNEQWGDVPPHWGIYIMVPDVDACVSKAKELGGNICLAPFEAPGVGRIGMISDPTGANCYVIQLKH
jgi:uncharacterized protein